MVTLINGRDSIATNAQIAAEESTVAAVQATINEDHNHPPYSVTLPNGLKRLGAVQMTTAANTENVIVGSTTYIFVTALGTPGAGEVEVKVQATVLESVIMLCNALQGNEDAVNIAYNVVAANAECQALYTSLNYSLGTTLCPAGVGGNAGTIILREKLPDQPAAVVVTVSSTTTGVIIPLFQFSDLEYPTVANRIRGDFMAITGLSPVAGIGPFGPRIFDAARILVTDGTGLSGDSIEGDFYWSMDETPGSFTLMSEGAKLAQPAVKSVNPFPQRQQRVPLGAGLYLKIGTPSDAGVNAVNLSVGVHVYPFNV